jgi:hypothetical protein
VWLVLSPLLFVFFSGPTDRYFYLPSIGYAIFVSSVLIIPARSLIEGRLQLPARFSEVAVAIIVAGLLLSQTTAFLVSQNRWRVAGEASGGVFHDLRQVLPEPHDYGAFFFVDLPTNIDGVPFLGNVTEQAVQLEYENKTLTASSTTCSALEGQAELPRYSYIFRFTGDGVRELRSAAECR